MSDCRQKFTSWYLILFSLITVLCMQTSMNNTTELLEGAASLNSPGFVAFAILVVVITVIGGFMNGLTFVALTMAHSIPRPLRLFLINFLLAGLVVALALVLSMSTSIVLVVLGSAQSIPLYLCRANEWLYAGGAVTSSWSLAAFSLSVLAVVKFGKKTISPWCAAVTITTFWTVSWVVSLYIMVPYVYEVQFVDGVACFPDNNNVSIIEARYTFLASWITLGGLIPLTISITVPIVCLCFIRCNIVTDGLQYRKGIVKFTLFLVLWGSNNVIGQVLPVLLGYYTEGPGVYIGYSIPTISFIPTSIIIIAYFKPVQEQIKKMLICGRFTKGIKDSTISIVAENS